MRLLWIIIGFVSVGCGVAGIVLPLVPTTPFLLLAAWAASRGSDRLYRWLHGNRYFGPPLRSWEEQRAVPARAKAVAVTLLALSWLFLLHRSEGWLVPLLAGVFFCGVAAFLLTRPNPR